MKKMLGAVLAGAMLNAGGVWAEAGDWLVRGRLIHINADSGSDAGGPLALPKDAIRVGDRLAADLDISYFFTGNLAAELVLTYPQQHKVSLGGADIGDVREIPAMLLAQYHFPVTAAFKPYIGVGVNMMIFTDRNLAGGTVKLDDRVRFGPAFQFGFDYALSKNWFLNLDAKKILIGNDVELRATGAKITEVDIDPWVYGVGIGYKF